MKNFNEYRNELNKRDEFLNKVFDFDGNNIELSEETKNRLKNIFDDAVKKKVKSVVESEHGLVNSNNNESSYIEELAMKI